MTQKRIKNKTKNKKVVESNERPFFRDIRNVFSGVAKAISGSDISFKVNNVEVKKDKENNMQFSMVKENFRTNVHVKNTGAISVETNTEG